MIDRKIKFKLVGTIDTTISGKLIYSYLTDIAGEKGEIKVSIREISKVLGISRKTSSVNLHRLQRGGYIVIRAMYNQDGGRSANLYIIR